MGGICPPPRLLHNATLNSKCSSHEILKCNTCIASLYHNYADHVMKLQEAKENPWCLKVGI